MPTCLSKSSRIKTRLAQCRQMTRAGRQVVVPCFDGPKGGLSAGEACPRLRPLMSSCALDTSAQRAPNIQLFTSKAQLLLPGPTAQARNRVGGGCMLTPPLPCQSWSPLGFASETSFLSSPAATLQGGSLWFPGGLHSGLLTGLPAPVTPSPPHSPPDNQSVLSRIQIGLCCSWFKTLPWPPLPPAPLLDPPFANSSIMLEDSILEPSQRSY